MDKKDYDRLTKDIPTEKWCPAPFVHGYINANNRANKLCCMSKIVDRFDGLSDLGKQFDDFWRGEKMTGIRESFMNNKMPEPCEWYCGKYEDEEVYEESMRLQLLDKYDGVFDYEELEINIPAGNRYERPLDIDLRPGKLCNYKCRSCNTVWSSEIEKEVLANPQIQGEEWYWDTITTSPTHMKLVRSIDWNNPNMDLLKSINLDNVRWLKMSGGETLIDPSVFGLWQRVVDSGHSKHIILHVLTNMSVFPGRAKELLKEFKAVSFNLSIDAIGPLEEYLRTGAKWEKQQKVWHQIFTELPNIKFIGTNTVIQVPSIFSIIEWTDWIMENGTMYEKFSQLNYLPIVDPDYLCIGWLDDDHKEMIRKDLDHLNEKYKDYPRYISNLRKVYSELDRWSDDPEKREKECKKFVKHTRELDKIRNENILDHVPQLERYMNRW